MSVLATVIPWGILRVMSCDGHSRISRRKPRGCQQTMRTRCRPYDLDRQARRFQFRHCRLANGRKRRSDWRQDPAGACGGANLPGGEGGRFMLGTPRLRRSAALGTTRVVRRLALALSVVGVLALVAGGGGVASAAAPAKKRTVVRTGAALPDFDHRFGASFHSRSAAQLAALKELGNVEISWNEVGTPHSLRARKGFLTKSSSSAPDAVARAFVRENAALFRQLPDDVANSGADDEPSRPERRDVPALQADVRGPRRARLLAACCVGRAAADPVGRRAARAEPQADAGSEHRRDGSGRPCGGERQPAAVASDRGRVDGAGRDDVPEHARAAEASQGRAREGGSRHGPDGDGRPPGLARSLPRWRATRTTSRSSTRSRAS